MKMLYCKEWQNGTRRQDGKDRNPVERRQVKDKSGQTGRSRRPAVVGGVRRYAGGDSGRICPRVRAGRVAAIGSKSGALYLKRK